MPAEVLKDVLSPSDHIWFQERFQEAAIKRYGRLQAACNEAVGSGTLPNYQDCVLEWERAFHEAACKLYAESCLLQHLAAGAGSHVSLTVTCGLPVIIERRFCMWSQVACPAVLNSIWLERKHVPCR